ncbi:NmrA family NAD(P)-binding protein [Desertivirga brevis]|uniref:NmrA family NAD(P)-binding protein n=1 Tax=Desertivirga brevis TaxID=2810310 RepID=UPI001A9765F4|nr:NAD(P)H-binding protein [Pedobacter sp. SYSU D00873]
MSKLLVLGATGKTGRRVKERLEKLDLDVRSGSRQAEIPFDWDDSTTWAKALENVKKVYVTFQPDLAVPGARQILANFTAEVRKAGVQKLVLLSGRGEKEAELCEQEVIQSGIDYSIVRASWFMQNFSESFFNEGILKGELIVPEVKALEPFIDADDIADVVVECLLNDSHQNKIYSITGPELLSFEQCTTIISEQLGREIAFTEVPLSHYTSAMEQQGLPKELVWLIDYLFREVLDGRNESLTTDLERILGRKARTFREFAMLTAASETWINTVTA